MSTPRPARPRVGWIFSLIRSGSSASAYAGGAPWSHPVADEPFGPWIRTGPVYAYPRVQGELVRAFRAARCALSERVVGLAERLFEELGARTGAVVVKHPHLDFAPADFRRAFPEHRAVWLLRNPLHRLNSIYARGLIASLRPGHELEHYRAFARNWLDQPEEARLVFDDLKTHPREFLARLWGAWEWTYEDRHLDAGAAYLAEHYHASCRETERASGSCPVSESTRRLPPEAIDAYLDDPFMRDLMGEVGWSTDPGDYAALAATP